MAKRKFWGWGVEGGGPSLEQQRGIRKTLEQRFECALPDPIAPPTLDEIALRPPRIAPPAALAGLFRDDPETRAGHTYGKSFRDVVRAQQRDFSNPPDQVAFPEDEAEVTAVLDWCSGEDVVVLPY